VWRADKPDPGRFREFLQFDLDTVGTSSIAADAEILSAMYDTLRALELERFRIRFSSRKVLNSLLDFSGIPRSAAHGVFRVLDKLDKIGLEGVRAELSGGRVDASGDRIPGLGLAPEPIARIVTFLGLPGGGRSGVLNAYTDLLRTVPSAAEAATELGTVCASLDRLGIPEAQVHLDLSIARGLEYYTGTVMEANLLDAPEFGAVFAGGRYDGLVERFLGRAIPAVGASIGVDRLFAALQKLGLAQDAPATAAVIVTVMEPSRMGEYEVIARDLRLAGIPTELYLGEEKTLGKQLQYANRQKIRLALIVGSDEFARGEVTIKDLVLGAQLQDKKKSADGKEREEWLRLSRSVQVTVPRDRCVGEIRSMLTRAD
jgi:histidyl-tRNA synthetase